MILIGKAVALLSESTHKYHDCWKDVVEVDKTMLSFCKPDDVMGWLFEIGHAIDTSKLIHGTGYLIHHIQTGGKLPVPTKQFVSSVILRAWQGCRSYVTDRAVIAEWGDVDGTQLAHIRFYGDSDMETVVGWADVPFNPDPSVEDSCWLMAELTRNARNP